ncbi:hypothetical protein SMD20_47940 [Nonomuraea sp. LP-02]|uniref:hypothetical protein n=1 Tax=Nonomuraea sp. LP-02 TaxID=3097960 RepID=UPI002E36D75E|nr:hypothetical protein [Nonomuraea sp. LP-02]MED7932022.1 hypothetical protein [Nonomuraea sp. LP-02]
MSARIEDLDMSALPDDALDGVIGGLPRESHGEICLWILSALGGGKSDPIDYKVPR